MLSRSVSVVGWGLAHILSWPHDSLQIQRNNAIVATGAREATGTVRRESACELFCVLGCRGGKRAKLERFSVGSREPDNELTGAVGIGTGDDRDPGSEGGLVTETSTDGGYRFRVVGLRVSQHGCLHEVQPSDVLIAWLAVLGIVGDDRGLGGATEISLVRRKTTGGQQRRKSKHPASKKNPGSAARGARLLPRSGTTGGPVHLDPPPQSRDPTVTHGSMIPRSRDFQRGLPAEMRKLDLTAAHSLHNGGGEGPNTVPDRRFVDVEIRTVQIQPRA